MNRIDPAALVAAAKERGVKLKRDVPGCDDAMRLTGKPMCFGQAYRRGFIAGMAGKQFHGSTERGHAGYADGRAVAALVDQEGLWG